MLLLISDANVLIDLETGGIVERLFRLNASVAVPDILFVEELATQHARLVALGLQVRPLGPQALVQVVAWQDQYPKPSRNDLIAFALAKQDGGILLTGDRHLRDAIQAPPNRLSFSFSQPSVRRNNLVIDQWCWTCGSLAAAPQAAALQREDNGATVGVAVWQPHPG